MKKTLFYSIAALLAFSSCAEELQGPENEIIKGEGIPFEITANLQTRTVNDGMNTKWAADDKINLFHAEAGATRYDTDGEFTIAEADLADGRFTGTLSSESVLEQGKNYDWYAMYPYGSKLTSPANENIFWTYIGSHHNGTQSQTGNDSMAHIAGSNYPMSGITKNVAGGSDVSINFKHLSSLLKIVVTNESSSSVNIKSISFATPSEPIIGTYYINYVAEPITYTPSGDNYVSNVAKLNVSEVSIAPNATGTFYMAIKPFTAKSGETLTVTIETDGVGATHEILLTKDVTFSAGKIKTVNATYTEPEEETWSKVTPANTLADGQYVILVKHESATGYGYLPTTATSSSPVYTAQTIFDGETASYNAIVPDVMTWNFSKNTDGTYKITNSTGKYLYGINDNKGVRVGNTEGSWTITAHSKNTSAFQFKNNANRYLGVFGNQDWRSYDSPDAGNFGTNQQNSQIILYYNGSVIPSLPSPTVTCTEQTASSLTFSWPAVENATGYKISTDGGSTYGATQTEATYTWTGLPEVTTKTIYVVAVGDGTNYINSAPASCEGTTKATPVVPSGGDWVKVTSAPTDWSGEYIIVYEDGTNAYVFNGKDEANGYVSATITGGNTISASTELDNVSVTIEAMTGGYSIKVKGGGDKPYISGTSGSNIINFNSSAQLNEIEYSSSGITIKSNTSVFRFNSNSDQKRFRYYKSGQKPVWLYKKVSGSTSGETGGESGGETGGTGNENGGGETGGGESGGSQSGSQNPAVDQPWLEMTSAKEGSQYVVCTPMVNGERNYTVFYDKSMYTPLWTAYPLNSGHMGSLSRPKDWSYNPLIESKYQINALGGAYSGYSRGHLCPNGSRNGIRDMQLQTFYMTNQVPQIQTRFNDGIWNSLENAVQAVGNKEEIYVVTGVAFNKEGESKTIKYVKDDSNKDIPVPYYFYKVVLRVKKTGDTVTSAKTVGFWFENKEYSNSTYSNYSFSVDQIEEWTGFDFFVNLPDDIENAAESQNTTWSEFDNF